LDNPVQQTSFLFLVRLSVLGRKLPGQCFFTLIDNPLLSSDPPSVEFIWVSILL
jgi:hypothetical protein